MNITSIQTNIQGQATTTALGRLTLLLGPNASGKDRVLRAVSLALTGTVDDLLGKDEVAKADALFPLATDNQIRAVATLDNGTIAEYALNFKADGSANKPVRSGPAGMVLGLRTIRDIFSKNEAGQRAFYMGIASQYAAVSDAELLEQVPAPLRDIYGTVAQSVRVSVQEPAVETLGKVVREAKRLALEQTKKITEAENALSAVGGDARLVTDAELEQHQRTRNGINVRLAEIGSVQTPVDPTTLATALEATRKQAAEEIATMQTADAWLAANPEPAVVDTESAVRFWSALETVASTYQSGMACPLSGGIVNDAVRQNTIQTAKANLAQLSVLTEARTEWASLANHYRSLREHAIREYTAAGQRYQALLERIAQNEEIAARYQAVGAERVRLQHELAQVSEVIARATAIREQSSRLSRLRTEIEQASEQKDKLRRLVEATEAAESRLLASTVGTFTDAVNSFLPALPNGGRFTVDQTDGGFRVGLVTDTGLRTALSGAEWNILTLAIGLAVAAKNPSVLHVLIPEDRGYDPVTLTAWMEQVARMSSVGQVLLASTVAPLRAVDGWTVVRTGTDRPSPPDQRVETVPAISSSTTPSAPAVTTTKGPDGYWRATVDDEPVVDNAVSIFATEQGAKDAAAREIASRGEGLTTGMTEDQVKAWIKQRDPSVKRLTEKRIASELASAGLALVGGQTVLAGSVTSPTLAEVVANPAVMDVAQPENFVFEGVHCSVTFDGQRWEGKVLLDDPEQPGSKYEQLVSIGLKYEHVADDLRGRVRTMQAKTEPEPEPEAAQPPASCPLGPVGKFVWQGNYADIGRALSIFTGAQIRVDKAEQGSARWEKYASGALVYVTATGAAVWSGTATYKITPGNALGIG